MQPMTVWTRRDVGGTSVVDTWEEGRLKDGAVQDFVGRFAPHARRHGVADMFGKADPKSKGFSGVRWEQRIMDFVTDRFQSGELKERTDVSDSSRGQEDGLAVVE